ncbi:MAG: TetR family transcriptional regulator C-terminal domain-containing protein [bacterium]
MAAKKKIDSAKLIALYMDYVLEHGKKPNSVYQFSKENNFDEIQFYQFFGSFDTLEKSIFETFFEHTVNALEKSDSYSDFGARERLLAFYFTFFELLTANRSYVMFALGNHKKPMHNLLVLQKLRKKFKHYVHELPIETLDLKSEKLESIQNKGIQESTWMQLLVTLKFWMDDDSKGFEKTDLFIEKSVNASFDLMNVQPVNSLIDLGKFLIKEKLQMA